jgi:hypothetical protein
MVGVYIAVVNGLVGLLETLKEKIIERSRTK